MRFLVYDMGTFTQSDIVMYLERMGIMCRSVMYKLRDESEDAYFEKCIRDFLSQETYDAILSVNYFPILARICREHSLPYLSWSYDSPINVADMESTLGYETNYIFFFDGNECSKYRKKGYKNVWHLPLAVNTERLDGIVLSEQERQKYTCDVSMVGSLYDTALQNLMYPMDDYAKGYLSAVIEAQFKLYGAYMLDDVVTEDLVERINQSFAAFGQTKYRLSKDKLAVALAKYITHMERTILLDACSANHQVHLYGPGTDESLTRVKWCGSAEYFEEMPRIFKASKVNLNISLKCIQTGIPLRVLDILGCGGFLLTNWQQEIAENFTDGEDLVMYTSLEDAVAKCDYYLEHKEERIWIARNGYEKVKKLFGYPEKLQSMLEIAGLL